MLGSGRIDLLDLFTKQTHIKNRDLVSWGCYSALHFLYKVSAECDMQIILRLNENNFKVRFSEEDSAEKANCSHSPLMFIIRGKFLHPEIVTPWAKAKQYFILHCKGIIYIGPPIETRNVFITSTSGAISGACFKSISHASIYSFSNQILIKQSLK